MTEGTPTTRFKVTMRSVVLNDQGGLIEFKATDYVGEDILDAYVTDAQTRWQQVAVEAVDKLPKAVLDGDYNIPEHLTNEAD